MSGRHFVRTALDILSGRPDKTSDDLFPIPWHEGRKCHPCEGQKTAAQADPSGNNNVSKETKTRITKIQIDRGKQKYRNKYKMPKKTMITNLQLSL